MKRNKSKSLLKRFFGYKVPAWILIFLFLSFVIFYFLGRSQALQSEANKTFSMVKYIKEVNEEVFLNVGIQEVETQTNNTKIPWTNIGVPLTEKKALVILNYDAKLGIKNSVKVKSTGAKSYNVEIPEYEVIGISLDTKKPYELYDSTGELLSSSTADIDTGKLATQSLTDEKQKKYIKQYSSRIDDSAKNYYKSLFKSVDSKIKLTFTFDR